MKWDRKMFVNGG